MEEVSDWETWEDTGLFTPAAVRRMLDIEYISEFAAMHGPQNKKQSIEKWYQVYEKGFEEVSHLRQLFQTTLFEIISILPDLRDTRWRKRSDFYTLFGTFAKHADKLPLPRNGRARCATHLKLFATQVDLCIAQRAVAAKETVKLKVLPAYIVKYTNAVEKSATDLANRIQRMELLEAFLRPVL